jgi:hypothetical protein
VATVSGAGLVTPAGVGSATISATVDGVQGTSDITVTQSVGSVVFTAAAGDSLLLPAGNLTRTVTVFDGGGAPLSGRTVTFSAAPAGLVDITPASGTTNASGQVTITITRSGAATGTAPVTATSGTKSDQVDVRVLAAMTSIALVPAADSLFAGGSIDFTATALGGSAPLQGRRLAISSANTSVADPSPPFVRNTDAAGAISFTLTGKAPGASQLTVASSTEGISTSRTMRVLALAATVTVSPSPVSLLQDATQTFTAVLQTAPPRTQLTGRPVTWATSDPAKLSIDATGAAVALDSGAVTVTATALNDVGGADDISGIANVTITLAPVASVSLTPASAKLTSLSRSATLTLGAQIAGGAPARDRACTVVSSNAGIASVAPGTGKTDQHGNLVVTVTGQSFLLAPSTATITATCEGVIGTSSITVSLL